MASGATLQPFLGVQDVSKSYGSQRVFENICLTIHEGDRIGLIGRNGSGKSTLLKILFGQESPDQGLVTRRQGIRVALLHQEPPVAGHETVGDVFTSATAEVHRLLHAHHNLAVQISTESPGSRRNKLAAEYEQVQHALRVHEGWNIDAEVRRLMTVLNVPSRERRLDTLSGGELRRLQLAATIASSPDVLLLDEPTNHIDAESAQWIEDFLTAYPGSCVLVTHDRYFLGRVVNRIVELDQRQVLSIEGNYEAFLERKAQLEEHAARTEPTGRPPSDGNSCGCGVGQKPARRSKGRIKRFEELDLGCFSPKTPFFRNSVANRLGKRILEIKGSLCPWGAYALSRFLDHHAERYARRSNRAQRVWQDLSIACSHGTIEPGEGKLFIGDATEVLYVDQNHEEVNPTSTVLKFISNGVRDVEINGRRLHIPAYLERFLFDRSVMNMEMQYLSGGEKNRLDLAKKLMAGGNFIVLDEPTNDLDLSTLRVLEEMVLAFQGCALVVSHDRYFLNRVCTHIVAFEDGPITVTVAGNYDDYMRYRKGTAEAALREISASDQPRRKPRETTTPRRLTWREKRELEAIEETILKAEDEVSRLQREVNAPSFYKRPNQEVQKVLAELEAAEKRTHGLYDRWSELEGIAGEAQ